MERTDDAPSILEIRRVLERRYGRHAAAITRLRIGQGTKNYQAAGPGYAVFVKQYVAGTNIENERDAIRLSEISSRAGVPTAAVIRNIDGNRSIRLRHTLFPFGHGPADTCAKAVWRTRTAARSGAVSASSTEPSPHCRKATRPRRKRTNGTSYPWRR